MSSESLQKHWPPSANNCGEASNHDVPDAKDSGGSGHTHSKSDSCHVSIIRRCEQDDSLVPTKKLHDVVRTNGCGVTTAGFSGDNTPLVVYPLVVEWADRMVFHIEYGSHRHNMFSFLLAQTAMESILLMFLQWGSSLICEQ